MKTLPNKQKKSAKPRRRPEFFDSEEMRGARWRPVFFCAAPRMGYTRCMSLLRFMIVLMSCLSFASASFAAVQMQCCAENSAPAQKEQMTKPCHDVADKNHAPEQSPAPKPLPMKGCNCVCSLQSVALPEIRAWQAVAVDAGQQSLKPVAYKAPIYIIYSPPRAVS